MNSLVTMVNVSDMDRSVKFYKNTLGLKLRFQSPGWSEFEVGVSTLALHGGGQSRTTRPSEQDLIAGTANIGFNVDSVDKTYEELKGKGVRFTLEPTNREGEGIRLAVFLDPDGLGISIAQTAGHGEHA